MLKKVLSYLLSAAALLCVASCGDNSKEPWNPDEPGGGGGGTDPVVTVVWHERANEAYENIVRYYKVSSGQTAGLFNENSPKGAGDGAASFLWPYDGLVSGLAAMNRLGYNVGYLDAVEKFQLYYRPSGAVAVGGYGSSTDGRNGGGDRFYDDNSIVGIELVEAYRQTGDSKYLDRCAQIIKFLKSGIDDVFGGALWWNESQKNIPSSGDSNKPACANGFATWFLMSYYEVCPKEQQAEVLDIAKGLYSWLYNNLRDPEDNVYWNSMGADGTINRTKWTYNSGAMIASGARLYRATGDDSYLKQAKACADGAYNYFVRSRNGIPLCYPTNDPWFTIQLIKSYIELEPDYSKCSNYLEVFIANLENAWENGRQSNGLFLEDWTGKTVNPSRDGSLLMQAAALESLATVALYKGEKK